MDDVAVETGAPLAVGSFLDALLVARRDGDLPADLQQAFSSGACHILELKAAHRQLCESTDALREAASEAKGQLDLSSLQLQNLLYERQHYEKEINSCRSWRSAYSDEQIALVSEAEFKVLGGELAQESDPHKLMLNRLTHEVAYRQEYVKALDGVKAKRDALAADMAQKRGMVVGLEAEIGKLLAAARAVQQQYAGAAGGEAGEQGDAAPPPPPPQVGGDTAMKEA